MSINDAISGAGRRKAEQDRLTQDAINRAIQPTAVDNTISVRLREMIEADAARAPVNQVVVSFDVQQFNERLSAVENRQSSQLFGVLDAPITRGQLVYWTSTGQLARATASDLVHANRIVGFADQSGVNTQEIRVVRHGVIENPMWNLNPNQVLFLGLDGEPTQNQVGLFSQIVGFVMAPTRVFVNIQKAVIRG